MSKNKRKVTIKASGPSKLKVRLDGKRVKLVDGKQTKKLRPGYYSIEWYVEGSIGETYTVVVEQGEKKHLNHEADLDSSFKDNGAKFFEVA